LVIAYKIFARLRPRSTVAAANPSAAPRFRSLISGHRNPPLLRRDRPIGPDHRRYSADVLSALSRPEAGAGRVPAAGSGQLDHLRQRLATRLAEHLPAHRDGVKLRANDLFSTPLDQTEIDFEE